MHASQVNSKISPVSIEYFPGEQSVHGDDPFKSLNVPATHAVHTPPSGPVWPSMHVQMVLPGPEKALAGQSSHVASEILAAPVEYLPLEHFVHGVEPFASLYVPATQATHVPPSGPEV